MIISSQGLKNEPPSSSTAQTHEPKGAREMENLGNSLKFSPLGTRACSPERHGHSVMVYVTAYCQAHGYSFNLSLAYETF